MEDIFNDGNDLLAKLPEKPRDDSFDVVAAVADDEERRNKIMAVMDKVNRSLGVTPLEAPDSYTPGDTLEEIIHYMRWEPAFLFDCPLEQLYQYEMALAAHITYVQAKENHWEVMVRIANRELERGKKLAAAHCEGKSVKEREALAMTRFPALGEVEKRLDLYNIYAMKCHNISSTLTQMDNSLKKTLERRRFEFERMRQYENGGKANGGQA